MGLRKHTKYSDHVVESSSSCNSSAPDRLLIGICAAGEDDGPLVEVQEAKTIFGAAQVF